MLACREILLQQTSDGAITMAKVAPTESTVIPYFGCFAASGLVAGYKRYHDPHLLQAALKWVYWYAAHQNADGTIYDYKGSSGQWKSTKHFDSSDSYAAVYLTLLWQMVQAESRSKWLADLHRSITLAVSGVRLTMQPCGLTIAKPDYPVMYTMDNVETWNGLQSAAGLARLVGDKKVSRETEAEAKKMESAIELQLWDPVRSSYRAAVQVDGGKMEGLSTWYPDIMANLMAIAWLPSSPRNKELFSRLNRKFGREIPKQIRNENDLERLVWWGWGANGANDGEMLASIRERLRGFVAICSNGCDAGLLGHVAMLTAQD
jgi:hypothetical protein